MEFDTTSREYGADVDVAFVSLHPCRVCVAGVFFVTASPSPCPREVDDVAISVYHPSLPPYSYGSPPHSYGSMGRGHSANGGAATPPARPRMDDP